MPSEAQAITSLVETAWDDWQNRPRKLAEQAVWTGRTGYMDWQNMLCVWTGRTGYMG